MSNHLNLSDGTDSAAIRKAWLGLESVSRWHSVDQEMVNTYTAVSGDGTDEWLHLDPARAAAETPYGGTIVQGFYQVAHLSMLVAEALSHIEQIDLNHALNYGFDRLRFVNPLPVGARFRAKVTISDVRARNDGSLLVSQHVSLELEDGTPTLVADWLFLLGDGAFQAQKETVSADLPRR